MTHIAEIEPNADKPGEDYAGRYGLSGYVMNYVDMFRRLAKANPAAAKTEYETWPVQNFVFARLKIWAAGSYREVASPDEFSALMMALNQRDFWPFHGERDLLLALSRRWNELGNTQKLAVEARILQGPPKSDHITRKQHEERSAHWRLNRLHWLKQQGCELVLDLEKKTTTLRKKAPDWKAIYAASAADDHDGRTGSVNVDRTWLGFAALPLPDILEQLCKPQERDFGSFTRRDPFAGLSSDRPVKALSVLGLAARGKSYPMELWETFLGCEQRKKDSVRLQALIGERLALVPAGEFKHVILTASRWFENVGMALLSCYANTFSRIWQTFLLVMGSDNESGRSALVRSEGDTDWATESINSPAGNLTQLLFKDPSTDGLKSGAGLPEPWRKKAEELLALPGDSRRFALVIFGHGLGWLFWVDPKWTESTFLSVLDKPQADDDRDALWDGFMWGARVPDSALYLRLKPHLLRMVREHSTRRRRHSEVLAGVLLAGWGSENPQGERYIASEELRDVLLHADGEFLGQILWHLDRWSDDENKWADQLLEFLRAVWPKQKGIRTAAISARLCELALSQKKNFPDVAREVIQLVSKVEDEHVFIPELRTKEETRAYEYPKEMLDLLYAILPTNPQLWPYGTVNALKNLEEVEPILLRDPKLIELKSRLVEP